MAGDSPSSRHTRLDLNESLRICAKTPANTECPDSETYHQRTASAVPLSIQSHSV